MVDIGIRRETINAQERRAALAPQHVDELVREHGFSVVVQPSSKRIYPDDSYRKAGAILQQDLSGCKVVLGIKEILADHVREGGTYLCFSHVIKGQHENMPLLQRMLDRRATLIDYEPIVDRFGRRLLFFGRHAGYAGMIDALWTLGRRMRAEGIETAFAGVRQSTEYRSVQEATEILASTVGARIRERGIDPSIHPLVVGFTGGGNVSSGAQDILGHLPVVEIEPGDLATLHEKTHASRRVVYKVVFRRQFRQNFAEHLPHLTLLVNGIYWEPGHPKIATRQELRALWQGSETPKLKVIADLSADIGGSIEATLRQTTPDDPVFVYDPETHSELAGVEGRGPVMLTVGNLPAEFPRDASEHFGDSLFPFLSGLRNADYGVSFEHLSLPAAVLGAVITHAGELTPRYRYLQEYLTKEAP